MTAETHGLAPLPRWLDRVGMWLPATAGALLFGGGALLYGAPGGLWWVLAALLCGSSYAARGRWPVVCLVASLLLVLAAGVAWNDGTSSSWGVAYLLLLIVPVLPLVSVASALTPGRSLLALAATMLATVAVAPDPVWSTTNYSTQGAVVEFVLNLGVPAMIAAGAWLAGTAIFARQQYAQALLERAVSLEETRDAEAARAVAEERARIARELHDVISHTVAVMVVQASAAGAVWEQDPEQARASLRAVEESGRTVMADLRGMLGTMRTDTGTAERHASPGVEQLPALVEQVRGAGLAASLRTTGTLAGLDSLTSLSLLRVAQESVTNTLRHAHASTVAIELEANGASVRLSIADDGVGLAATRRSGDSLDPQLHGGHGIDGMRERARTIGATLDVESEGPKGTKVTIRAPLRGDAI